MDNYDRYECLGFMMCLMSQAENHGHRPLWCLEIDLLPALEHDQFKIYFNRQKTPIGFVTWAWLDDDARRQILRSEEPLSPEQWRSGHTPMIYDLIAPWGHRQTLVESLTEDLFRKHNVFCVDRNADGSIHKIHNWRGVDSPRLDNYREDYFQNQVIYI